MSLCSLMFYHSIMCLTIWEKQLAVKLKRPENPRGSLSDCESVLHIDGC